LQKWILAGNTWQLAYTLTAGLNLGKTYAVPGYPTDINPVTGKNWEPARDGLRQIAGKVTGDQGADPNQLVVIKDKLSATTATAAAGETFKLLRNLAMWRGRPRPRSC
jgi:hypothetical protein